MSVGDSSYGWINWLNPSVTDVFSSPSSSYTKYASRWSSGFDWINLIDFFSINAAEVGLIFGIVSFFFGVGSLPMSFLYNKYGPKKLIVFSQLGILFSALLVSISNSVVMFSLSSILLGLFASIHHPVSLTLISETFDKNIAKANAFHGVFGSIGVSLGPLILHFTAQ